jgi:3-deoxy-D-manno-octulosonate 8-phosphate phosphatase (KDO 8-P phosphatase)
MSDLQERLAKIKVLVLDTDGVLTDGGLLYPESGESLVRFHIQDGMGVVAARLVGLKIAIISARKTAALARRAEELGITEVVYKAADKAEALRGLASRLGWNLSEAAYLGDDLNDIPPMKMVGAPLAVANAVAEVKEAACWVSTKEGGNGAVRETVETILSAQGRWEEAVEAYLEYHRTQRA